MKIRDESRWNEYVTANTDPYGGCCVKYAEAWANEMEARMAKGETVEACADDAGHVVDRRPAFGITGFMYGMAVKILAECWEHGEALRRWHNLQYQINDEGERANESGGVINPAVMVVEDRQ